MVVYGKIMPWKRDRYNMFDCRNSCTSQLHKDSRRITCLIMALPNWKQRKLNKFKIESKKNHSFGYTVTMKKWKQTNIDLYKQKRIVMIRYVMSWYTVSSFDLYWNWIELNWSKIQHIFKITLSWVESWIEVNWIELQLKRSTSIDPDLNLN